MTYPGAKEHCESLRDYFRDLSKSVSVRFADLCVNRLYDTYDHDGSRRGKGDKAWLAQEEAAIRAYCE